MKISAIQKRKKIAKNILIGLASIIVLWGAIITSLALYLKIHPVNVTWLLNDLKNYNIVSKNVEISNLSIGYNKSIVLIAKNIKIKDESFNSNTQKAFIKISPLSLLRFDVIIKEIAAKDTKININAQNIKTDDSNIDHNLNIKKILTKINNFIILKKTKSVKISNADIDINFKDDTKYLNDINIKFVNTKKTFIFDAKGDLKTSENNNTPITIKMFIPEDNKKIKVETSINNIFIEDVLNMIFTTDDVMISGKGNINLFAEISKKYKIEKIYGSTNAKNGFVNVNLYKNKLNFNSISGEFLVGKNRKSIELINGKIQNKNGIDAKFEGRLALINKTTNLDIEVTTPNISFNEVKKYIPDLEFKDWINENITGGDLSNVSFEFHGPLNTSQLDGAENRPYMNIIADFKNLSTKYYEKLPPVQNAEGKFRLLKNTLLL